MKRFYIWIVYFISTLGVVAAPGEVDITFGSTGVTKTNLGGTDTAYDMALDSTGRTIVVGSTSNTGAEDALNIAIACYDTNGVLDATFGTGGILNVDITGGTNTDALFAVVIDSSDNIIAAGYTGDEFLVVRYTSSGVLDATFGSGDGYVTIGGEASYKAFGVAIDSNDKIVMAGYDTGASGFHVRRLNADGTTDTTFNGGAGWIETNLDGFDNVQDVVVDSSNRPIVIGRGYGSEATGTDFIVLRYTNAGILDTTFGGGDGYVIESAGSGSEDQAYGVALDSQGRILVAGIGTYPTLKRFSDTGVEQLDVSVYPIGTGLPLYDVAVDDRDSMYVVGSADEGELDLIYVARYLSDGTLDETFGLSGLAIIDAGSNHRQGSVKIDSSGRVMVAGVADDNFVIARLLGGYNDRVHRHVFGVYSGTVSADDFFVGGCLHYNHMSSNFMEKYANYYD